MRVYQMKHTINRDDLKAGENRSTVEENPIEEEEEHSLLEPLIDLLDEMQSHDEALPLHSLVYYFIRDCRGLELYDMGSEDFGKCTCYEE